MQNFCSQCGTSLPVAARFCPACGLKVAVGSSSPEGGVSDGILSDRVASCLAYLFGFISGIVFLNLEPYRRRPLVRFHAWQATLYCLSWMGLSLVEQSSGLFFFSWLFTWPIHIGALVVWIILLVKAYNGEMFKLPLLGNLAQAQAEKNSV